MSYRSIYVTSNGHNLETELDKALTKLTDNDVIVSVTHTSKENAMMGVTSQVLVIYREGGACCEKS